MKEAPTTLTEILITEGLFFFLFGGICYFLDDTNYSLFLTAGKFTLTAGIVLSTVALLQKIFHRLRHSA